MGVLSLVPRSPGSTPSEEVCSGSICQVPLMNLGWQWTWPLQTRRPGIGSRTACPSWVSPLHCRPTVHAQRVKSLRNTSNKAGPDAWPRPSSEEQSLLGLSTCFPCVGHFLGSDTLRLGQASSPFMHPNNSITLRPKEGLPQTYEDRRARGCRGNAARAPCSTVLLRGRVHLWLCLRCGPGEHHQV